MGQMDICEKHFTEHNDIFADLVNMAYFAGIEFIKPESLTDRPARQLIMREDELGELERDVCKICKEAEIELAIYGLENQSEYDRFMPIRTMEYNAWCYMAQLDEVKDGTRKKIVPVVTLVVSFSTKKWRKNKKLSELLNVPEYLKPYFTDYKINLLELAFLSDEQIARFKTADMRAVAGYLRQKRLHKDYKPSTEELRHVKNVIMVIAALSGDKNFKNVYNRMISEGKEPKTMCEMIDKITKKAKAEGLAEGEAKGIAKGLAEGKAEGLAEGEARGLAEGIMQKAIETARVAISLGLPIAQIMALTNLPEKTILQLM